MPPTIHQRFEARDDGAKVAWLTIDNRAKLNCLDNRLTGRLRDHARALAEHDSLRAVVLTGAGGRAFIGGADIGEMAQLDPTTARVFITTLHDACQALRNLPVPVIARIDGYCLGAGLEIAASCDLRVASEKARLGMPEVRVGIPSVIEAALLPRLVGWGKARELVLTGEILSAREAAACGLVERVVARADLDAAVEKWLGAVLDAGPLAIRLQKALIGQWEQLPLDQAIETGIDSFVAAYQSDEPHRLMQAFLNRRG